MEMQSGSSPLPLASLSLTAFAPNNLHVSRVAKARLASALPPTPCIRDGLRSHPISDRLTVDTVDDDTTAMRGSGNTLVRLLGAVPLALGRLLNAPVHQPVFGGPGRLSETRIFPSAVRRRAAGGGGSRPAGGGARKPAVVWFRNDLRLHDNPSLEVACREGSSVLPVYIFDPRDYSKTPSGFHRTGPSRTQFILEAVAELRSRLRAAGSELVVRLGPAEEVVRQLAAAVGAGMVVCEAEVAEEEVAVERRVRAALERDGCQLRSLWGGTLYHVEDLPFRLDALPTSYADFRSRVAGLAVRPLVDSEGGLRGLPAGCSVEPGELPSLEKLGMSPPLRQATAAGAAAPSKGGFGAPLLPASESGASGWLQLRGGEGEALRHLQAFVAELKANLEKSAQQPEHHQQPQQRQRPGAASPASAASVGPPPSSSFSCRISPWLALGCLSPRRMYHELRQQLGAGALIKAPQPAVGAATGAAAGGPAAGGANWLVFELLWRDFFRFVTHKYTTTARPTGRTAAAAGPPTVATAGGAPEPVLAMA